MAVPVWSVGQVLTASDVNAWFVPVPAYKASDTSRSNTVSPSADPDMTVSLAANAVYSVLCYFDYEGSSTTNQALQWVFIVPLSAVMRYHCVYTDFTGTELTGTSYTGTTTVKGVTSGAGVLKGASLNGMITMSSSSGSLTLTWAQNVSEGTAVTLHANSHMQLRRVG